MEVHFVTHLFLYITDGHSLLFSPFSLYLVSFLFSPFSLTFSLTFSLSLFFFWGQVDKENKVLHITDTGIGMTKKDLITHLGTIAKSGTSEFLAKVQESGEAGADTSNLIGQFGVGFYSAFLVADTVVVTTKHNDDKQYIWTSNAAEYSIVEDPREDEQLKRGTRISLYLKEEAQDFLDNETIRGLVKKYSEFINWDIYLYTSKTVETEEEEEEEEEEVPAEGEKKDEEAEAEAEVEEEKPKEKKKVTKTVWDWEVINANKPIWTRNPKDVSDEDYNKFYQAFSKDSKDPLTHIHFTAEGEVTFRSILYVPSEAPQGFFSDYGKKAANIKVSERASGRTRERRERGERGERRER